MRVIVPSDLAQTFSAICAHYRYRVIHRTITIVHAQLHVGKSNHACLEGLATKKYGGAMTHLHT